MAVKNEKKKIESTAPSLEVEGRFAMTLFKAKERFAVASPTSNGVTVEPSSKAKVESDVESSSKGMGKSVVSPSKASGKSDILQLCLYALQLFVLVALVVVIKLFLIFLFLAADQLQTLFLIIRGC